MPGIPSELLHPIQASLEQWEDNRSIRADDLEDLLVFEYVLPFMLPQFGMRLCGVIYRQKQGQTLMTVKVKDGDTPLVVFVTSDHPTACRRRWLTLWEEDRLTWVKDKYPWI